MSPTSWFHSYDLGRVIFYLGLLFAALAVVTMAVGRRKRLQRRIFAWFYGRYVVPGISRQLRPCKEELFRNLVRITSRDPKLAARGCGVLRILEIGIGTGINLEFYPAGTQLVSVEPNIHFKEFFDKNRSELSHVELEKSVLSTAEDMKEVEDKTVDVVVSTYVLCSVTDLETVLKEILRVLAPGGQFLYLEHVPFKNGTWGYLLQQILEPVWKIFSDDCRLTSPTIESIKNCGFATIEEKHMEMEHGIYIMKPHVMGVATK